MGLKDDRIYAAQREGLRQRLADTMGLEPAEAVIAAWEAEAQRTSVDRVTSNYWWQAETWIAEQPPA